ncbi:MAG TPA: hypothetical protein VKR54_00605 [Candidatus Babeliales bacterium]|jgi:hypothetical protein|nr:hypothetical protein [Candidatus Babeliales bacterium]
MKKIFAIAICLLFTHHIFSATQERRVGINAWGTHFPVLATVVANTTGPILEMGCGDYSTPMLHGLCAPTKRTLVSTDASKQWLEFFADMQRDWHTLIYVPAYGPKSNEDDTMFSPEQDAWDSVGADTHWNIVFIDHRPGLRRVIDIERLRSQTDIFVIHDAQDRAYGYDRVLKTFKYVYEYRRYHITTKVVSDTIDVAKFFEL